MVWIIDADTRRRASITYYLNNLGIHAEPFETIEEFLAAWPRSGTILVHDETGVISALVEAISARHAWQAIVAYSDAPEPSRIVDAVLEGAVGYAAWPGCGETLIKVLRDSATRSHTGMTAGARQIQAMARIERLSRREREILAGMSQGLSNRMIGEQLNISPRTVELHRANLLAKTGAKHSAEAIRWAIEASLPKFEPAASNDDSGDLATMHISPLQ
ncbi:response regulator transcription factor [Novosphingobium sp. JCM 18896]|uniref:response regulator transcription factor n=1 Tax=Novosphingobium sp. JCM 18896 TaxID=2989731 RepID=UPI002223DA90|nr:LuxR C-terminal-related transcriptional regulator [Novosphingobium sp. JCM 18896]MCW1430217.1 LuxR C-terminal-related transcriptional regulator [Novosphingobium sp. JCM 18896]